MSALRHRCFSINRSGVADVRVRLRHPTGRDKPRQKLSEHLKLLSPYKVYRPLSFLSFAFCYAQTPQQHRKPTDCVHQTVYSRSRYRGSFLQRSATMTYPFCIAPWVHASAISFILPECLFIPAAHGISCRRVCFWCIVPPYPHIVVSARRLFYAVVLYERRNVAPGATIRCPRDLPDA